MKKRVLLVEDHPGTVEVMRQELEVLGYQVEVAENGLQAVQMSASAAPDAIVMDILMPEMNGLEAVAQIRANPSTREIPILAATALARPGEKEKCLAGGCDGYIAKPFTHKQLGAAIEKAFAARSGKR